MPLSTMEQYEQAGGDNIAEADLTPDFKACRLFKQHVTHLHRSRGCLDAAVSGFESMFALDGLSQTAADDLSSMLPADPDNSDILLRLDALRPQV